MSQVQDDKPPDFQLLSLSGGGFRGLYTAQILAHLERHTGQPIGRNFDLIAGTSVGGILALAVALEIPMEKIVNLFVQHGGEIFRKRPWWHASFGGLIRSTYTADSLKKLLSQPDIFGDLLIADLKHRVLIPSINYTRGAQVVFKTSHHPNFAIDLHHKLVDVALATSAAPTFFPRHSFNSNQYVDGGLFANNPALLALHEVDVFFPNINLSQVGMLSIGTMGKTASVFAEGNREGGAIDWAGSKKPWQWPSFPKNIIELSLSMQDRSTAQIVEHRMKLEGGGYLCLDDLPPTNAAHVLHLDNVKAYAIDTLRGHANERAKIALGMPLMQGFLQHQAAAPKFFNLPAKNTDPNDPSQQKSTASK